MRIMNNISAMNAHRLYTANNSKLSKSLEKLSSGYAINRAGDNAAGLAVSEKMRAQIAGLEQASKNAQDGISMVQTYEGALTETDSILQRMRSLAVQSANGNYDNSVDRVAIEQEFKQLNAELDQIADTDFNGVIVLNGGKMADGLKAVDGVFDYANKAGQVDAANAQALADAQAAADEAIANAQSAYDAAKEAYDNLGPVDLSNNGQAAQWNAVDNKDYGKKQAEAIFGYKKTDGTWAAGGIKDINGKSLAQHGATSVDVTFEAKVADDGTITWTAIGGSAVDKDGEEISFDKACFERMIATTTNANGNTGEGGFKVGVDMSTTADGDVEDTEDVDTTANAIFDSKKVKTGDTVTLTFTNNANTSYAPNNIGMDTDSVENTSSLKNPQIKLSSNVTDKTMTQELSDILTKLDNATVTFENTKDGIKASISDSTFTIKENDKTSGQYDISYKDAQGKEIIIATVDGMTDTKSTAGFGATPALTADSTTATYKFDGTTDGYDVGQVLTTLTYDGENWIDADGNTVKLGSGSTDKVKIQTSDGEKDVNLSEFTISTGDNAPIAGDKIEITVKANDNSASKVTAVYDRNIALATDNAVAAKLADNASDDASVVLTYNADDKKWYDSQGTEVTNAYITGTLKLAGQSTDLANLVALTNKTNAADANLKTGDKIILSVEKGSKDVKLDIVTAENTNSKISFGIALDSFKYDNSGSYTVQAGKNDKIDSDGNNAVYEALQSAEKALADAKAARPESIDDLDLGEEVSKSNAFEQATGKLTYNDGMTLQVGARTKDLVDFTFEYDAEAIGDLEADLNCTSEGLGTKALSLATQESANAAIDKIDHAINKISMVRGTFGAIQNRLEHKISNLDTNNENLTAAESRIRDTDMAAEMMEFTKNQILSQASQSMLAQANQLPQGVLSLLQ